MLRRPFCCLGLFVLFFCLAHKRRTPFTSHLLTLKTCFMLSRTYIFIEQRQKDKQKGWWDASIKLAVFDCERVYGLAEKIGLMHSNGTEAEGET